MLQQLLRNYNLWEGPHDGAGQQHEEEGAGRMKCCELAHSPSLCAASGGEGTKESKTK